jgi:hypothetical protein
VLGEVVEKIRDWVEQRGGTSTYRDLRRACVGGLRTKAKLDAALRHYEQVYPGTVKHVGPTPQGGRPGLVIHAPRRLSPPRGLLAPTNLDAAAEADAEYGSRGRAPQNPPLSVPTNLVPTNLGGPTAGPAALRLPADGPALPPEEDWIAITEDERFDASRQGGVAREVGDTDHPATVVSLGRDPETQSSSGPAFAPGPTVVSLGRDPETRAPSRQRSGRPGGARSRRRGAERLALARALHLRSRGLEELLRALPEGAGELLELRQPEVDAAALDQREASTVEAGLACQLSLTELPPDPLNTDKPSQSDLELRRRHGARVPPPGGLWQISVCRCHPAVVVSARRWP